MRRFLVMALILASVTAIAQVNVGPIHNPRVVYFDANGKPLAGGMIYTYAAGGSTPLATYTDSTGSTPNANPVMLDSSGVGTIWLGPAAYKIVAQNALGVQQWSVDNVTSPTGAQNFTSAVIAGGSIDNTPIGATTPGTGKFTDVSTRSTNSIRNADDFAGADIDAKVNAAFAACANACTVYIPAGTYNAVTTTIQWPMASDGRASLWCDDAALINYTGSGDWLAALGAGQSQANVHIYGKCKVDGHGSAGAGIHLRAFNEGHIDGPYLRGWTNGILNEGANHVTVENGKLFGSVVGLNNTAVSACVATGLGCTAGNICTHGSNANCGDFGANAVKVFKNLFAGNSYAVVEQTNAGSGGNSGNSYTGNTFELNTLLHMSIQALLVGHISGNYFEYAAGSTAGGSISISGTGSGSISILDNFFTSPGATQTISISDGSGYLVENNMEYAVIPAFLAITAPAKKVRYGANNGYATAMVSGISTSTNGKSSSTSVGATASGTGTAGDAWSNTAGTTTANTAYDYIGSAWQPRAYQSDVTTAVADKAKLMRGGVGYLSNPKIYTDTPTLSGGTLSFTLRNSFAFADTTYVCSCQDMSARYACAASPSSTTVVSLAGNGNDALHIVCFGN